MSLHPIREFAFTYHLPEDATLVPGMWDADVQRFSDCMRSLSVRHFIYQLEKGTETGRLHYQGYFQTEKKVRIQQLVSLVQEVFPGMHLSPSSTAGRQALKTYCMKADTRVAGPWKDGVQVPTTALEDVVSTPFDGKKKFALLEDEKTRRPFQEALRLYTREPPDDRTIVWVTDTTGNSGKTIWARWMRWKYGSSFLTYGSTKDVLNLVCKEGAKRTYIFNLPRSRPKEAFMMDLFNTLESIKDGEVINMKYETSRLEMDCPHVIVLANFLPSEEERQHLSRDRWKFFGINRNTWDLTAVVDERVE